MGGVKHIRLLRRQRLGLPATAQTAPLPTSIWPVTAAEMRAVRRSWTRPLGSAADLDHLVDSDEMVFDPLAAVETGGSGLLDDHLEVAVIHVPKHTSKIPTGPEFVSRLVGLADFFEKSDFLAHGLTFYGGGDQNTAAGQAAANLRTSICPVMAPPSLSRSARCWAGRSRARPAGR